MEYLTEDDYMHKGVEALRVPGRSNILLSEVWVEGLERKLPMNPIWNLLGLCIKDYLIRIE